MMSKLREIRDLLREQRNAEELLRIRQFQVFILRVQNVAAKAINLQGSYIGSMIECYKIGEPSDEDIALLKEANRMYGLSEKGMLGLQERADAVLANLEQQIGSSRAQRRKAEREMEKMRKKAASLIATLEVAYGGLRQVKQAAVRMGGALKGRMEEAKWTYHVELEAQIGTI